MTTATDNQAILNAVGLGTLRSATDVTINLAVGKPPTATVRMVLDEPAVGNGLQFQWVMLEARPAPEQSSFDLDTACAEALARVTTWLDHEALEAKRRIAKQLTVDLIRLTVDLIRTIRSHPCLMDGLVIGGAA